MTLFDSEYNKKRNHFEQGVTMIRNKNNNFFLNAKKESSIYDLTDIASYYNIYEVAGGLELVFRPNTNLPANIKQAVTDLFNSVFEPQKLPE